MDVQAIHTALVTLWPDGIPREQYVALAGIFKVCGDLEVKKATDVAVRSEPPTAQMAHASSREMRDRVYDYVNRNPGTTLVGIVEGLQLQAWAVGNHLRRLKKDGRLVPSADLVQKWRTLESVNTPATQRPASPGPRKGARAFVSVKTTESVRTLLVAGARTKTYIEKALSLSPRAVRYALATLREQGLVKRIQERAGKPHLFELA